MSSYNAVLTIAEAAEFLKIGRNVMYRTARQQGFPVFKVGRQLRVRREDLERWIEKQYAAV